MVDSLCLRAIKSVPKSDPSEILRRNSAFVIHYLTLKIGVKIKLKATINEIVDNGIIVNDELIEADKILCAVGRTSNTENLFDNKLIDVNNGSIVVDDNFKTFRFHLYLFL